MKFTAADVYAAQAELSRRHLIEFVKLGWHTIEPAQPYVHGWHMDAIAQHLEAVASGEITRLLINVPPGTSKSTLVGVFFPMWLWGPQDRPSTRIVGVAHEQSLGVRDNLKCRRLVSSDWYSRLWGDRVKLMRDQNEKINFENAATGFRQVATPSNITGRRGDIVILDDPLSAENANSEVEREKVNLWFREALPTRLNNPDSSAIVVVMQRLHERDVSGLILTEGLGYEHLMLPMEFEPERKCYTSIGFEDPRTEDGELLFPERFPPEVVERDKKVMGSYAWAGQAQQRPAPREGGLFKLSWFADKIVDVAPEGGRTCRAWDLAGTVKKSGNRPDWTVGVKVRRVGSSYYVEGVSRFQDSPGVVASTIKTWAATDPRGTIIRLPQDPGQAGKAQAESLIAMLAGYDVRTSPVTGDKETRARPAAVQAEAGNVYLVRGEWNQTFLDELCTFPMGTHDDQVDALADALNELALGAGYDWDAFL
jgi:predicted phage terminase large subunit-like protein